MTLHIKDNGPIILVDDDTDFHLIVELSHQQSKVNNSLLLFESGVDCLQYLEKVKTGLATMPTLILLDINMPNMNGFEVLQSIRSQPEFKELPIISMFTCSNDTDDMQRSMQVGATAYKVKPFSVTEIVDFFNSLIE